MLRCCRDATTPVTVSQTSPRRAGEIRSPSSEDDRLRLFASINEFRTSCHRRFSMSSRSCQSSFGSSAWVIKTLSTARIKPDEDRLLVQTSAREESCELESLLEIVKENGSGP